MLHSLKLIREYYPQYKNHKIAVISPCIAKKREFDETGYADYNVTMLNLKNKIVQHNIDLASFPVVEYEGLMPERAVLFSTPGGLLDTAERFIPGIRRSTRKIEGVQTIYSYLAGIAKNLSNPDVEFPLLIDCLNCEYGCNGGTGTGNAEKTLDELESPVRKRSKELENKLNPKQQENLYTKYHKELERYWKPNLYNRSYINLSSNNEVKRPNEDELKEVYHTLKKDSDADIYDCTACGYQSCRRMATAIFNKLNKVENCAHYNLSLLEEERKTTVYINQQLKIHISRALKVIERINDLVVELNKSMAIQRQSVEDSSEATGHMVNSLKSTSDLSREKREILVGLIENAAKGQDAMKETVLAVKSISESVDGISSAIKIISVIASNTNLLAMNAAIEAAHAGEAGKGFAVVADEIRRLSETTRENSRSIAQTLSNIIGGITTTSKHTGETGNFINDMSNEINGFASTMTELIDTLGKLSSESSGITTLLNNLQEHSSIVSSDYGELLALSDKLRYDINYLAAMSADIVRAIEENDQEIINRLIKMEEKIKKHEDEVTTSSTNESSQISTGD
jgi:methyl-accepting chemotaxis protein